MHSHLTAWICLSLLLPAPVRAAWVSLCETKPGNEETLAREYIQPDGSRRWLFAGGQPVDGCQSVELPVSRERIRWMEWIPAATAEQLGRGMILQGSERDGAIQVSEIITRMPARGTTATRAPLPLLENMLGDLNPRTFGIEGRARLRVEGSGLTLHCEPGRRPAGLLLRNSNARLPEQIELGVEIRHRADPGFALGYSDAARLEQERPLDLGMLAASALDRRQELRFATEDIDRRGPVAFSLICPEDGGVLDIGSLTLVPPETPRSPPRATWVWRSEHWIREPTALVDDLEAMGAGEVYISVPVAEPEYRVADPASLSSFVAEARSRGIRVWAVEGDPHAVLPDGRAEFVRRARAFADFNQSQASRARLSGIQYDIEPYLLSGFTLKVEAWLEAYVETIAAIDESVGLPLELAVPFWWADMEIGGRSLLDTLAPHVERLAVMDYRTDPRQIQQFAEPFLTWAARSQKGVRIALEVGPIADALRWQFGPANEGALWHFRVGAQDVLLLLRDERSNPFGSAFVLESTSLFPGSLLTFEHDRERLHEILNRLERVWPAWPSFAGVALHEYLREPTQH